MSPELKKLFKQLNKRVMKSNDQHGSRSENARNESRDADGKFTSKSQSTSKAKDTSHMGEGRGTKSEKESLNPHDKMQGNQKSSSHDGRGSNAKNEERDSQGRFKSEK